MTRPDWNWIRKQVLDGNVSFVFALELLELVTGRKPTVQDVQALQELKRIAGDRKRVTVVHV